jgi:hypothetical protein
VPATPLLPLVFGWACLEGGAGAVSAESEAECMSASMSYERVRDYLERLKMEHAPTALDTVLERGQKKSG